MGNLFTTFTNCRILVNGELIEGERLVVSQDDGLILKSTGYIGGEIIDLDDLIIAPGFLELHSNGVNGFHFTSFENESQYSEKLLETAKYYLSQGVTGFWTTIPTVDETVYKEVRKDPLVQWRPPLMFYRQPAQSHSDTRFRFFQH
jgi:N-acetylglucosamine-6-phosphate deacetylase